LKPSNEIVKLDLTPKLKEEFESFDAFWRHDTKRLSGITGVKDLKKFLFHVNKQTLENPNLKLTSLKIRPKKDKFLDTIIFGVIIPKTRAIDKCY